MNIHSRCDALQALGGDNETNFGRDALQVQGGRQMKTCAWHGELWAPRGKQMKNALGMMCSEFKEGDG